MADIRLLCSEELDINTLKDIMNIIYKYFNTNEIGFEKPNGTKVKLLKKIIDNKILYRIPTNCTISINIVSAIANDLDDLNIKPNWSIEIDYLEKSNKININYTDLTKDEIIQLATDIAKLQHRNWINKKIKQGWRYGLEYSLYNKTNPMLRPWEDLPEKYKDIDEDIPNIFIDLLNRNGHKVITTTEIRKLTSIAEKVGLL